MASGAGPGVLGTLGPMGPGTFTGPQGANKKAKTAEHLKIQVFHKNWFLAILNGIWEVWGVRGHGMYHTKRFPRTLAGFGVTWHGGIRFSCILEILETHFIT